MNETYQNPIGTKGFAFIEFSSKPKDAAALDTLFTGMCFSLVGELLSGIKIYRQGNIFFLLNTTKNSHAENFADLHGPSVSAVGFHVEDSKAAIKNAVLRNGENYIGTPAKSLSFPAITGVGGSLIYFVDDEDLKGFFELDASHQTTEPFNFIDHITHNLYRGQMSVWKEFYEKIFNFRSIRYFDIDGKKTGLQSYAMCSPCGNIKIPLNESKDDLSQIAEYLKKYNGMGIQHIALSTNNIYHSVDTLKNNKISLLDTPDSYYELIEKRLPNHGEPLELLKKHKILIDGTTQTSRKLLLQIFSENVIGPIFFEFIQRKGDDGFGEGNFKALFESIELDQMRREVI